MNNLPWQVNNWGLEGRPTTPNHYTSRYDLQYLAKRIGCSIAAFDVIGDFITCWNIAVHGKGE